MILELIGLIAAYNIADDYNEKHDEIETLKNRLNRLERKAEDYEYISLRNEIREIRDRLRKLS